MEDKIISISIQGYAGRRSDPNAGIAIGPILFIIAILAVLAAAIASGSGSFTSGTSIESDKTKSSALMQIGENLKIGMDRIVMEGGYVPTDVDINTSNTTESNMLFSPTGGGIAPPSVGMANNPSYDRWTFPQGNVAGFGTTSSADVVAVLPVSQGVCSEVNNRVLGTGVVPPVADLGSFVSGAGGLAGGANWPAANTNWTIGVSATKITTAGPTLVGSMTGCVYNSTVTTAAAAWPTSKYFFYQILAVQ